MPSIKHTCKYDNPLKCGDECVTTTRTVCQSLLRVRRRAVRVREYSEPAHIFVSSLKLHYSSYLNSKQLNDAR